MKMKTKKIILVIAAAALVIGLYQISRLSENGRVVESHSEQIEQAEQLMDEYMFDDALACLQAVDEYSLREGQKATDLENYLKGLIAACDDDYQTALVYFTGLQCYRDSEGFAAFCQLAIRYNSGNYRTTNSYVFRKDIIGEYTAINVSKPNLLSTKMLKFKAAVEARFDEMEYQEDLELYKKLMPYKGMSVKYINDTIVGPYDEKVHFALSGKDEWFTYRWHVNRLLVLEINADPDRIISVKLHNGSTYWTSLGDNKYSPRFGPYYVKESSSFDYYRQYSGSSSSFGSDPYHASDYYDAEDMYEDYPDDFYDVEDAQDYWDENH